MGVNNIGDFCEALRKHPSVLDLKVEAESEIEGYTKISTIWNVQLPRKYVSKGVSGTGVKSEEEVYIFVAPEYPLVAPVVRLRIDFPLDLPHINPHKEGRLVNPCVSEVPPLELLHSEGIEGYLYAINDWLNNAAANELHDPSQGWERIRQDDVGGIIFLDTDGLIQELQNKKALYCDASCYMGSKDYIAGNIFQPSVGMSDSDLRRIKVGKVDNNLLGTLALVLSVDSVIDKYQPQTVEDIKSLQKYCKSLAIDVLYKARFEKVINTLSVKQGDNYVPKVTDFFIILSVKRPYKVIGTTNNEELIGYRVTMKDGTNSIIDDSSPVTPVLIQDRCSPSVLKSISGCEDLEVNKLALLGCGSLGSKLALHLAKTGVYEFDVYDEKRMSNHNNARHGLISSNINSLITDKSELLAKNIKKMAVPCKPHNIDICILGKNGKNKIANKTDYIIDSTASLPVRYFLSSHYQDLPGKLIQCFLLNKAKLGVTLIEGDSRNPRVDDLNAFLYQLGLDDNNIGQSVYNFDGPARQFFSGGCDSFTTKINDMDISIPSSMIAKSIHQYINNRTDKNDFNLRLFSLDGITSIWVKDYSLGPSEVFEPTADYQWNIRVLENVKNEILDQSHIYRSEENGGVLLGQFDRLTNTIYITGLIEAPEDSIRGATKFILGKKGLENKIKKIAKKTEGRITFMGTWHSHPNGEPQSEIDKNTLNKLQALTELPVVMLLSSNGELKIIEDK